MLKKEGLIKYLSENKSCFREKHFVDRMAIIGSYARGDYDSNSDVDLIVYFLPEAKNHRIFKIYYNLQNDLSSHLNKNVDIRKVLPAFKNIIDKEALYV
ncbi:MAG: hypothetical protein HOO91_02130 [Bacteroidales bacterium]|nr:hypothetical protein [Bacteroidales bacterium]